MRGLLMAAFAAAVLCAVALPPGAASAHGGAMAAGFVHGAVPVRVFVLRRFRFRFFHGHGVHAHQNAAEPVVFGPPGLLAPDPPSYGERFNEARPPVWRECIAQTRMVPSSEHRGLTPVAVTRCWRRN